VRFSLVFSGFRLARLLPLTCFSPILANSLRHSWRGFEVHEPGSQSRPIILSGLAFADIEAEGGRNDAVYI